MFCVRLSGREGGRGGEGEGRGGEGDGGGGTEGRGGKELLLVAKDVDD